MLEFLSPAWVDALDEALRGDPALPDRIDGLDLVVEQRVTGTGADGTGEVTYHVAFRDGRASAAMGPADAPTVRFSQDVATARAIAAGTGSAQRAFMTGRLTVGGDLRVLLDHGELLTHLGDVFAQVRARTAPGAGA
jgi:hypothetical protein